MRSQRATQMISTRESDERTIAGLLRRRSRVVALAFWIATLALMCAPPLAAAPTPVAQREIDHLLEFVARSPCTFIRNGAEHRAPDARDHLAEKFRYARGRISTAEEFIRGVATGSSVSGEPYRVRCGSSEFPAAVWLTDELRRFREK
jgi:hypothetical protein